jgi:hypothetical protein
VLEPFLEFESLIDKNRALLFLSAAFETQTVGWAAGALVIAPQNSIPLGNFLNFKSLDHKEARNEFDMSQTTLTVALPTETSYSISPAKLPVRHDSSLNAS